MPSTTTAAAADDGDRARWPSWRRSRPRSTPWSPLGPDLFVVRPPEAETWFPVTFYALPTGERYMHFGARATRRVG